MQAIPLPHRAGRRNLVPLSPGVSPNTASEVYDAVRYKTGETPVRAGQASTDNWYVYSPVKEGRVAAATYKAASIKRHRLAMSALLVEISNTLTGDDWSGAQQKKAIIDLRLVALKKDTTTADFRANELTAVLKPLNDHLRGRQRLVKTSALKSATSPLLKSRRDYLNQFLKMSDSDLRIMQQALFSKDDTYSFQEKKLILRSIFGLIKAYLNQKEGKKTLAELIRQSPQQDLLLKFARAWLQHVDKQRLRDRANLLVVFSWQKTMTFVCEKILATQSEKSPATPVIASPERSLVLKKMIYRSDQSMNGTALDTPTKFAAPARLVPANELSAPSSPASRSASPVALQTVAKTEPAAASIVEGETFPAFALYSSPGPVPRRVSEDQLVEVEGAYEISVDPDAMRRTDNRV